MFGFRSKLRNELDLLNEKSQVWISYKSKNCSGFQAIDTKDLLMMLIDELGYDLSYEGKTRGHFEMKKRAK